MKNQTLFAAAMLLCAISFAQIQKGAITIGGGLGASAKSDTRTASNQSSYFNSSNSWKSSYFSLAVHPAFNFFISTNTALGLSLGTVFVPDKQQTSITDQNGDAYYTASIKRMNRNANVEFSLKRFWGISEKAFLTLKGSLAYRYWKSDNVYLDSRGNSGNTTQLELGSRNNSIAAEISPSFFFLPGKRWGIELSFGRIASFSMDWLKNTSESYDEASVQYYSTSTNKQKSNGVSLGLSGMNPSIGVHYFLKN